GWKKYATLQPKYCLAETPQALSRGGLADRRRKGSGFLESAGMFSRKNFRLLFGFVSSLKVTEVSLQSL
ncbi:hypothetical protein ACIQX3_23810, partial [Peribacillus frigoritolerans]|uniref:hypothetical protein n=1 Tax=Peribacillus frigoritolerans TaxID=450367 RepID=UPI003827173F